VRREFRAYEAPLFRLDPRSATVTGLWSGFSSTSIGWGSMSAMLRAASATSGQIERALENRRIESWHAPEYREAARPVGAYARENGPA